MGGDEFRDALVVQGCDSLKKQTRGTRRPAYQPLNVIDRDPATKTPSELKTPIQDLEKFQVLSVFAPSFTTCR